MGAFNSDRVVSGVTLEGLPPCHWIGCLLCVWYTLVEDVASNPMDKLKYELSTLS